MAKDHQSLSNRNNTTAGGSYNPGIPKEPCGVDTFLSTNPLYDGRGVLVAVFDSGIDPSSDGMKQTSHGLPKLVHCLDASASGDVDTSMIRRLDSNGCLIGLSGRTLKIPSSWPTSRNGEYRVGLKRIFDLYHSSTISRMRKAFTDRYQKEYRCLAATLSQSIQERHLCMRSDLLASEYSVEYAGPLMDCILFRSEKCGTWFVAIDVSELGDLSKATLLREFSEAQEYAFFCDDSHTVFSVAIFNNGNILQIVTPGDHHGTHVGSIVAGSCTTYPNRHNGIAPGAQLLSIKISDSRLGSMETVEAMVRAIKLAIEYGVDVINMSFGEPSDSEKGRFMNEVAQLVQRHGILLVVSAGNAGPALSTINAPAISRHVIAVGAFVTANMKQLLYSLVNPEEDVQFTFSSRGPTPSGSLGVCVSAPGAAFAAVPTFMLQNKEVLQGTSMASPQVAGSIALVMSGLRARGLGWSPTIIRRAMENTAHLIHNNTADSSGKCDVNSEGTTMLDLGHGLVQVQDTFDYVTRFGGSPNPFPVSLKGDILRNSDLTVCSECSEVHLDADADISVTLPNRGDGTGSGLYLRDSCDIYRVVTATVRVTVSFAEHIPKSHQGAFALQLTLRCNSSWVHVPSTFLLCNAHRSFSFLVNPTTLDTGLHVAEVIGVDNACPKRGPIIRVPITVVIPHKLASTKVYSSLRKDSFACTSNNEAMNAINLDECNDSSLILSDDTNSPVIERSTIDLGVTTFLPGKPARFFLDMPPGVTWGDMLVESVLPSQTLLHECQDKSGKIPSACLLQGSDVTGPNSVRRVAIHFVQLRPELSPTRHSQRCYKDILASPGGCICSTVSVLPNTPAEICISLVWNSMGGSSQLRVQFVMHGICPSLNPIMLNDGVAPTRIEVTSLLRRELLSPVGSLTKARSTLRPTSTSLDVRDERFLLYDQRQEYALKLDYPLRVATDGTEIRLLFEPTAYNIYDSPLGGPSIQLFDAFWRLIAIRDYCPRPVKLDKGHYSVRLRLFHDRIDFLTPFINSPLIVERTLSKPVPLAFYSSRYDSLVQLPSTKLPSSRYLLRGETYSFFAAPLCDGGVKKGISISAVAGSTMTEATLTAVEKAVREAGKEGAILEGTLYFGKGPQSSSSGGGKRPGGFRIICRPPVPPISTPAPTSGMTPNTKVIKKLLKYHETAVRKDSVSDSTNTCLELKNEDDNVEPENIEPFLHALRDLKISWLSKLASPRYNNIFTATVNDLQKSCANYLPFLQAHLHALDSPHSDADITDIITAADAIITIVDTEKLLAYFGSCRNGSSSKGNNDAYRTEMEKLRDVVVDAIYSKACAIASVPSSPSTWAAEESRDTISSCNRQRTITPSCDRKTISAVDAIFEDLELWIDPAVDTKYYLLYIWREWSHGRLGNALNIVNKRIKTTREAASLGSIMEPHKNMELLELTGSVKKSLLNILLDTRIELLRDLGWAIAEAQQRSYIAEQFPTWSHPF